MHMEEESDDNSGNEEMAGEEEEESQPGDRDIYFVEKILADKLMDGKVVYLVKWANYPIDESTWEPAENILEKTVITVYENSKKSNQSGFELMETQPVPEDENSISEASEKLVKKGPATEITDGNNKVSGENAIIMNMIEEILEEESERIDPIYSPTRESQIKIEVQSTEKSYNNRTVKDEERKERRQKGKEFLAKRNPKKDLTSPIRHPNNNVKNNGLLYDIFAPIDDRSMEQESSSPVIRRPLANSHIIGE